MKKRVSKKENNQQLKQGSPNSIEKLEGGEGGRASLKFFFEEFWSFNVFDVAKLRFSSHQLIKINMICLYIKPEVKKKHDATAMITAINETCIGVLYENDYLVSGIFLMREMSNLLVSRSDSAPNLQGFP